ncbi:hypothetical protein BCR44DRAFT_131248 [Catenaria anguillulae PL171]|uniref:Nudix hydrolase domain-containing protein n=1 Tax=Catenaria anguillulae PL171 TaxID=765915 RepID=A0A1Y2I183_9FUNG|nr:hypothetical protein BCR44DRAFT_131248 [Catenaria anguillulae PL171]
MGLSAIPGLPLWAAILISALFAATICIVVSLAIERFGGIVGGLLGSLPLNVIPPALGLWLQFRFQGSPFHDPFLTATGLENFQRGLISIIGGMLLNVPFLLMWQHLPSFIGTRFPSWAPSRVLAAVLVISISCWILLAIGIVSLLSSLNPQALATGNAAPISAPVLPEHLVALYGAAAAITAAMIIVGVIVGWSSPPAPKGKASVPFPQLLLRGCLAACAIGASVALGQVSSYAAVTAALRESWEEAGVRALHPDHAVLLGTLEHTPKGKPHKPQKFWWYGYAADTVESTAAAPALQECAAGEDWPEHKIRERAWFPLAEARKVLTKSNMVPALEWAIEKFGLVEVQESGGDLQGSIIPVLSSVGRS